MHILIYAIVLILSVFPDNILAFVIFGKKHQQKDGPNAVKIKTLVFV